MCRVCRCTGAGGDGVQGRHTCAGGRQPSDAECRGQAAAAAGRRDDAAWCRRVHGDGGQRARQTSPRRHRRRDTGRNRVRLFTHLDTAGQFEPNSITVASSELAPNMFGASSELASVMEFGFYAVFTQAWVHHVQLSLTVG